MRVLYLVVAMALTLTGCNSSPVLQSSQPFAGTEHSYSLSRSPLLDQTNSSMAHLDSDKNIVYSQLFGGGGVGLGLLLGPLGVAANVAMINAQTESDTALLKDKLHIKPLQNFLSSAQGKALKLVDNPGSTGAKISPYLYVSRADGEQMLLAAALLIEQGEGKSQWTGKYMYQLPKKYAKSELATLDEAQQQQLDSDLTAGFDVLLDYITHEQPPAAERSITFKSAFLNPRFDFDMTGALISQNDELTWVRTYSGVYALRKSNFTLRP